MCDSTHRNQHAGPLRGPRPTWRCSRGSMIGGLNFLSALEILGDVCEANLAEAGVATALIESVRPALVFNLAGYGADRNKRDHELAQRINTELPEEIASALARACDLNWGHQVYVHTGTALEYGRLRTHLKEKERGAPMTLYGTSKLRGSDALLQRAGAVGLRTIVARLFTVYGPYPFTGRQLMSAVLSVFSRGKRACRLGNGSLQGVPRASVLRIDSGLIYAVSATIAVFDP